MDDNPYSFSIAHDLADQRSSSNYFNSFCYISMALSCKIYSNSESFGQFLNKILQCLKTTGLTLVAPLKQNRIAKR